MMTYFRLKCIFLIPNLLGRRRYELPHGSYKNRGDLKRLINAREKRAKRSLKALKALKQTK